MPDKKIESSNEKYGASSQSITKKENFNIQIADYLKPLDIIKKPTVRDDDMDAAKLQRIIAEQ